MLNLTEEFNMVLNPASELYKLQEPQLDKELLEAVEKLNQEAEKEEADEEGKNGRNLAETVMEIQKGLKANLVVAQAEAITKIKCYDNDICVGDLFVDIRPGLTIKLYRKKIEDVNFVKQIQKARLFIAAYKYHITEIKESTLGINQSLEDFTSRTFDSLEAILDSLD